MEANHNKVAPDEEAKGKGESEVTQEAEAAREAVKWVLRRLDVLEYLTLFLALALALLGGAVVAWVLDSALGLSFRAIWITTSLLLFILPGGFVYLREFRKRGSVSHRSSNTEPKDSHE